jgi:hypothetical protein
MKIDFGSVIKAGGVAAAAAVVLGIISQIPFFGPILWFCFCIGGFLIPVGAGALYGYFAPGQEELGESALGGLLAGGTAGIIYGIFQGLTALIFSIFDSSGFVVALTASAFTTVFSVCGFAISGLLFGAIGGMLWPLIQQRRSPSPGT